MSEANDDTEAGEVRRWYHPDGSLEREEQLLPFRMLVRRFYRSNGTLERYEGWDYPKHKSIIMLYNEAGKLEDLPDGTAAVRRFFGDGSLDYENYYPKEGDKGLPDGSADIRNYYPNGTLKTECWGCSLKMRTYYPDGSLESEVLPSSDGTTTLSCRPDGSLDREVRGDGGRPCDFQDGNPAVRVFRRDGSIEYEEHYNFCGELDDPSDGSPAVRWYHHNGTVSAEAHYRHGVPSAQHQPDSCETCKWIIEEQERRAHL